MSSHLKILFIYNEQLKMSSHFIMECCASFPRKWTMLPKEKIAQLDAAALGSAQVLDLSVMVVIAPGEQSSQRSLSKLHCS